ncbi:MAG: RNA-binding protein [Leptospira sp.]|nr:RNA-binding protein [Leptospira sp.]
MKISVGNLSQTVKEDELKKLFSSYGEVSAVHIKRDKKTNVSLGYGSVEMADKDAEKAIKGLNDKDVDGKKIVLIDAEKLQAQNQEKNWDKSGGTGKIHGQKSGGFSGSTVRRSGGGGRGK